MQLDFATVYFRKKVNSVLGTSMACNLLQRWQDNHCISESISVVLTDGYWDYKLAVLFPWNAATVPAFVSMFLLESCLLSGADHSEDEREALLNTCIVLISMASTIFCHQLLYWTNCQWRAFSLRRRCPCLAGLSFLSSSSVLCWLACWVQLKLLLLYFNCFPCFSICWVGHKTWKP